MIDSGEAKTEEQAAGFIDVLIVLARHKRLIFGLPLVVALASAVISWLLPNVYTATARILPPQQNQSSTAMLLSQLGGLSGLGGNNLGLKNPADLYVGMLKSRTIADNLVSRFDLQQVYERDTLTQTRMDLADKTVILAGKDGIIVIDVDDREPKRAASLANAYVEELYRLTQTLAITEASQRRLFFEKQLVQAKSGLADAEVALKQTQESTGLIKLDDQGKAIIESIARIRGQIAAKEVQLSAMRTFATEQNPDYLTFQQELAGLRVQLAKLDRTSQAEQSDILVSSGKIPQAALEYIRKLREVKYHETVFELLARQYEIAKVDEARDTSVLQVLDAAVLPEKKSRPKRLLIVVLWTTIAAIFGLLVALLREAHERSKVRPDYAERVEKLHLLLRN